jgi:hypothetical protein
MLICFAFSQVRFRRLEITVRQKGKPALVLIAVTLLMTGNALLWRSRPGRLTTDAAIARIN